MTLHKKTDVHDKDIGFQVDENSIYEVEEYGSKKQLSKKAMIWEMRHAEPFLPIQTIPNFSRTFLLPSNKGELFSIPLDAQLLRISHNGILQSVNSTLLCDLGSVPQPPVIYYGPVQSGGTNPFNYHALTSGFIIVEQSQLIACVGAKSIGFYNLGANNVAVSLECWTNLQ